ncbi:MAG: type II toxin-antitoxin system RelE/ParE family toxin [Magnetococcales bacterium]|nr:type II toxin-antitoxin system RelE/ParE family toxin [Magnetococcales bacterium]
MYAITYEKNALKMLQKMPRNEARRVLQAVERLASDPRVPGLDVKALRGESGYRLRVGDWRVLYELLEDRLIVWVLDIGARGGIYS